MEKVYNTHWENDTLIIENLSGMYTQNWQISGSVGILENFNNGNFHLYLTTRKLSEYGVNIEFTQLKDEYGNDIILSGTNLYETPFAYGESTYQGYTYIRFFNQK